MTKCKWCDCEIEPGEEENQMCRARDGDLCEPKRGALPVPEGVQHGWEASAPPTPPKAAHELPEVRTDFGMMFTPTVQDASPREKELMQELRELAERMQCELNVGRLIAKAKDKSWTAVFYFRSVKAEEPAL